MSRFFLALLPPGTLLRCDRVAVMLRLHSAKLVKRIPLRFTRENQISFPFCSVKRKTQDLRNRVYGTKKVFPRFFLALLPSLDTFKVAIALSSCFDCTWLNWLSEYLSGLPRENQISFPFCSVKCNTLVYGTFIKIYGTEWFFTFFSSIASLLGHY